MKNGRMTPANSRPSPGEQASRLRVTKKLASTSRGAIQLAREFGEALICVRHRTDSAARYRYTTVELLVDKTPVEPCQAQVVNLRINPKEYGLRTLTGTP